MGSLFNELNSKTLNAHHVGPLGSQWSVRVTEGPHIQTGRGSHAGGVVDGKVVVIGGSAWNAERTVKNFLKDSEVFGKDGWTQGPDLPIGVAECAFAQDDTGLYLAGGLSGVDQATTMACCIAAADGKLQIRKLPDLPNATSGCSGVIVDGKFFVVCGRLGGRTATNRVWSLDLASKDSKWIETALLPGTGRAYPGVVACAGSIYVLGGLADGTGCVHDRTLNDAFRYDPKSDCWYALGSLPIAGYCWSAAPIDAKHVLLAGRTDGRLDNEIWLLDMSTLDASIVGQAVIPTTCAPLIKVSDNIWWLIGGEPDGHKNRTNRISEVFLR
jgi:N-acetylneuraminic acid mutarotase